LLFLISILVLLPMQLDAAITVAVRSTSANERSNFIALEKRFNLEYPDIKIKFVAYRTAQYKQLISHWLSANIGPDIFFWHAGERLQQFVRNNYVANLDDIWRENKLYESFTPSLTKLISYEGSQYAVPISYYHWGFYYNRELFKDLSISAPKTWQQFLELCIKLKKLNINPISLGSSELWPVAAWFDYLNLRINGFQFHQSLLSGELDFEDPRVRVVFEHWQELIKGGYFLQGHEKLLWSEALPFIYRKLSGFTLVGNFAATILPVEVKDKIGFFPFPIVSSEVENAEEAPTDVFFMRANTENLQDAKLFMKFVARADIQTLYNQISTGFPANRNAVFEPTYLNLKGRDLLQGTKNISQYFDRQTPESFSTPAMAILAEFMLDGDIDKVIHKLEAQRKETLLNKN